MEATFIFHVFGDDIDVSDVRVFTSPELAADIQQLMISFAEARGM